MPKIVPKVSKRVLNMFWGKFFEKFFCPVFHGGSSLRNVFKIFFKIPKTPKIVPKLSKRVLNVFWCNFFRKCFLCSMEGRVFERSKNQKTPKIFSKIFLPSVPWRVESSKRFWKIFKIQKTPKTVPKLGSKRVLNMFWGNSFENFFAQCSTEGRVFEMF